MGSLGEPDDLRPGGDPPDRLEGDTYVNVFLWAPWGHMCK